MRQFFRNLPRTLVQKTNSGIQVVEPAAQGWSYQFRSRSPIECDIWKKKKKKRNEMKSQVWLSGKTWFHMWHLTYVLCYTEKSTVSEQLIFTIFFLEKEKKTVSPNCISLRLLAYVLSPPSNLLISPLPSTPLTHPIRPLLHPLRVQR